jgi:hypothetical protein
MTVPTAPLARIPSFWFPDITFRSRGSVPPIRFRAAASSRLTPASKLLSADVPAGSSPIRLPATTLSLPAIDTPLSSLLEMTLPRPMVLALPLTWTPVPLRATTPPNPTPIQLSCSVLSSEERRTATVKLVSERPRTTWLRPRARPRSVLSMSPAWPSRDRL